MGFSKGGVAALYSSNERFQKTYGPRDEKFAAHIALYAQCYTRYRDDNRLTSKPVGLFHGLADDWIPVEVCRAYVERAKKNGADITTYRISGRDAGLRPIHPSAAGKASGGIISKLPPL
jgi:dienelactone hydrolase